MSGDLKTDKKIASSDFEDAEIMRACEHAVASHCGSHAKKAGIKSLRLIHGYVFTYETKLRCRQLLQRLGGKSSSKHVSVSPGDAWTIIDENKSGDFDVQIKDSCHVETCHKCKGDKNCLECAGAGKVRCEKCGGSGKEGCSRCGGDGLERCLNCDGKGYVKDIGFRNCASCHGSGLDQNQLRHGYRGSCFYCGGTGQEEFIIKRNCPTCGGDGKITCKLCQGKGNAGVCAKCNGSGKVKCGSCSGTGKCQECGGAGRATYTWYCVQKELTVSSSSTVFDNDVNVSCQAKKKIVGSVGKRANGVQPIYEVALKDESGEEDAGKAYGNASLAFDSKNDNVSAAAIFDSLKSKLAENTPSEVVAKAGKEFSYKVAGRRCSIVKVPMLVKCELSVYGKTGYIYVDFAGKDVVAKDVAEVDKELGKTEDRCAWRKIAIAWDVYIASALAVVGLQSLFCELSAVEYLKTVFTPALVAGIFFYLAIGRIADYFHNYVWRSWRVERDYFGSHVRVTNNNWSVRLLRLMWILVPMALCQGLCRQIPAVENIVSPFAEWVSSISENAWAYIAAVCALKLCFVVTAVMRRWGFLVFRIGINGLAVFALMLALWPSMLPGGCWLQSASAAAVSFLNTPVRFLALILAWPIKIVLGLVSLITGFVGEGVVGFGIWVFQLFK